MLFRSSHARSGVPIPPADARISPHARSNLRVRRATRVRVVWGGSSAGRASALQAEGRGFESLPLHHSPATNDPPSDPPTPPCNRRAARVPHSELALADVPFCRFILTCTCKTEHGRGVPSRPQTILDLVRDRGLVRPRDLLPLGFPRVTLTRMVRQGTLVRIARGLYALPDRPVSEHATLAELACGHPNAVVCLL